MDTADTTEKGLNMLMNGNYHLVITDLEQKPSGVDVFNYAATKGIDACIMTGAIAGELLESAKKITGNKVISKPFDLEEHIGSVTKEVKLKYQS